jgi:hypothetical protein
MNEPLEFDILRHMQEQADADEAHYAQLDATLAAEPDQRIRRLIAAEAALEAVLDCCPHDWIPEVETWQALRLESGY